MGDVPATATDLRQVADAYLSSTAAIRRTGRRDGRRPVELSSMTGSQLELARLVRRRPGISIAGAAEELRLAPNTVSTLVRELTGTGQLLRDVDPTDRRVARLRLSPGLGRKIDAWRDRRVISLAQALERLPDDERERVEAAVPALASLAAELDALGLER